MTYRFAFPMLALLVAGGCSGREATGPVDSAVPGVEQSNLTNDVANSPRSGALLLIKNCSEYTGLAGSFCTITASNLKQIPVGSRVVYAEALGFPVLDTDIKLDPPGPGNNIAFGHVVLNLVTNTGTATFSGGTGKFSGFHATLAILPVDLALIDWHLDGTYSFDPK